MALLRRRGPDEEPGLAAPVYQPEQPVQQPVAEPQAAPAPAPEPVLPPPRPAENASRFQLVEGAEEMLDMPLGTLIFRAGLIAPQQLEDALAEGLRTGKRLGEVLLARGWLSEEDLTRLLAGQKGLPYASPSDVVIDQELASRLSYDDARREMALPLVIEFGVPVVAMADPSEDAMDRVRLLMGEDVRFVVSAPSALAQAIDHVLGGVPAGLAVAPLVEAPPVAAAPGLAPISVSEAGIVPLTGQEVDEQALTGIAPQTFEETTPLVDIGEIDYPNFGQYEALPEAEMLAGPTEQLPPELQGGAMMGFSEESYAEADAAQPIDAGQEYAAPETGFDAGPEPVFAPEPEPAPEVVASADWSGNGASEQPFDPGAAGAWSARPAGLGDDGAGEPGADAAEVVPPEQWAAGAEPPPLLEPLDVGGWPAPAAQPEAEPPAEEPSFEPDEPLAGRPAWALGEVSANAAELLSAAAEVSGEEAVMDEPISEHVDPPSLEETRAVEPAGPESVEEPLPEVPVPEPDVADLQPAIESEQVLQPSVLPAEPEPEPVATEPEPVAEREVELLPEPEAAHEPEAAPEPVAEPEPVSAAEPPPVAEPEQLETIDAGAAPEAPSVAYFEVILRLADGERLSIDSLPTSEAAQERAQEIIMQVGASESGKWPFIAGRFLRPDTILSVDIENHAGWAGSGNRSRMFQGPE